MTEHPFQFCADAAADDLLDEIETPHEDEPDSQETFICSWDELVFEMTHGDLGTPPRPRNVKLSTRYASKTQKQDNRKRPEVTKRGTKATS